MSKDAIDHARKIFPAGTIGRSIVEGFISENEELKSVLKDTYEKLKIFRESSAKAEGNIYLGGVPMTTLEPKIKKLLAK